MIALLAATHQPFAEWLLKRVVAVLIAAVIWTLIRKAMKGR